jgi:flavin reductase (DIM6/NTAB) family NADH-FMN oxidoreductase RutF
LKHHTEINPTTLRDALRFWTTGVTIVSAAQDGRSHGMTANSFTSLSLEPPLVLVSLEKRTRTHDLVQQAGAYAVSVLAQDQQSISDRFAGRDSENSQRFADLDTFELQTGSPILSAALAYFDCEVDSTHDAGTHTLFVGRVVALGQQEGQPPLVYFNRDYRKLTDR